ncbi:uncharacterized protein B0I36DRAFT_349463 [Microdochium trichocladiopsis]|uniref:Rho-GAP domain-containing protein n=1 Tax=Microdochium trichocladiopsis TaxID=1682393 RepID=A0A9P9BQX6_9PEZI|nr:uncharacterized protein B0I36DRAFT_349463 [Microdochium trichocladiopsis]KAH7031383.1 hypothetical protein B0I36DRAFT_349463 [Microdochium trichocladiopsis]
MESLAITTDCITLGSAVAKATWLLNAVVREVRESRSVLDNLSRELHSLEGVLDLLQEDAESFPQELAADTPVILERCQSVVDELDAHLSLLNQPELSSQERRRRWFETGKDESIVLQKRIAAHRAVLGLAIDLVGATAIREIRLEAEAGRPTTIQRRANAADAFSDIARILNEMEDVYAQTKELETDGAPSPLHHYIMTVKAHVEAVLSSADLAEADEGAFVSGKELFPAYIGDGPDSAISINEEPLRKTLQEALANKSADAEARSHSDDDLGRRNGPKYGTYLDVDGDGDDGSSMIESVSVNEIIETITPRPRDDMAGFIEAQGSLSTPSSRPPTPPPKDVKRLEAARNNMVSPFLELDRHPEPVVSNYGVFTEITSNTRKQSSGTGGKLDRIFGSQRRKPKLRLNLMPGDDLRYVPGSQLSPRPGTQSTQSGSSSENMSVEFRPSTPVIKASLVRRSSKRLSVSLKKLPLWSPTDLEETAEGTEFATVFGVSLQRSMAVAKGTSKTHHGDNGGSSRRDFPLCMQKSCFFIKQEGIGAPNLFADAGDGHRVRRLKDAFARPPTYGNDVNWSHYTVYDAADLILLFLSQLPKPLVSESIAKRWVVLARQSTLSGALSNRLEQCIDFWEEALSSLRGPHRSLFKLLLNLWADIADASEVNDMTAERLAAAVIKPLMHIHPEKYDTDFILALAYLIRKRGEYIEIMKSDKKTSEIARITRISRIQGF